jgi:hypothetical protein
MTDLINTILAGGFAGAAVAAVLAKFLIENQLSKSLKTYQHELDLKKNALETELAIYAHNEKAKLSDFGIKRIAAIESIYGAFVKTSLPRHRFIKRPKFPASGSPDAMASAYFQAFQANFDAFKRAFDCIAEGFSTLEFHAIYVDEELERKVVAALGQVNACFAQKHKDLQAAHDEAQRLFRSGMLGKPETWFDFEAFHLELNADWNSLTSAIRTELRKTIRELLKPIEPRSVKL